MHTIIILLSLITAVPATVVRVIDGDTVILEALGYDYRVRIKGMQAPEMTGRGCERSNAITSREHLRKILGSGKILMHDVEQDYYANRIDARITVNGKDVTPWMISLRQAMPYTTETRKPKWECW